MSGPGADDWVSPAAGPDDWTGPTLANTPPPGKTARDYQPQTSTLGSATHAAERGVLPGATGLAVGVPVGEAVTGLTAPFLGPAAPVAGAVAGLGAGYLGAERTQEAEAWAIRHLPERVQHFLGQDEPQQAAEEAEHPYATMAGTLGSNLLFMRPGAVAQDVAQGAGTFTRTLASPGGQRVLGATLGGGQEAAAEEAQTGHIDPVKVSMAATAGALMNKPTKLGGAIMEGATAPQRVLSNIARGKPADAPTQPTGGADDWVGENSTPPPSGATAAATPQSGMPGQGEAVGVRFKSGPPQRGTVDHYFDNGNAVRLRMDDGSTHDLTTADLLKNRTEPPAPIQPTGPVTRPGPSLDMNEAPFPEDWELERPPPPPARVPLGGDMLNALDHADRMEQLALNQNLSLSGGARQDMLAEAARLRRLYGRNEDTPDSTYRPAPPSRVGDFPLGQEGDYAHPLANEPAADLGELAAARAANPALYEGERAVPPPENVQSVQNAPGVDPYALEDVVRAKEPPPKGETLFDAIRAMGGIKDQGGDVNQIMRDFKNPRFVKRVVNQQDGLSPDQVRANLQEDGWWGPVDFNAETGTRPGDDLQDLYDLMDRQARGENIYHPESTTAQELEVRRQLDEDLGRAGVSASDPDEVAAQKLADYRKSELAEQDAWNARRAAMEELPPEEQQEMGYEPGSDIGAELEVAGEGERSPEGPEDWVSEEGARPEAENRAASPELPPPEENPVEREGGGEGVNDWRTSAGAIQAEHEAEISSLEAAGAKDAEEGLPHTFSTEPGAVDARGRPVDQTIIPGAEGSAQQLADAREAEGRGRIRSRAQQKEPGGLFEEPDEQKGLFEQPRGIYGSSFSARAGAFKDLAPEFVDWMQRGNYPMDNPGISQALREYLINRGAATEHEALALHDPENSAVSHIETTGHPGEVMPSEAMANALMDPNAAFVSHHNHPVSRSLSDADIGVLSYPGMRWVVVHGHDGNFFAARLSPKWRAAVEADTSVPAVNRNFSRLKSAATHVQNAIAPYFQRAINNGRITVEEADDAWNHATMQAMARTGAIDYISSKELASHVQEIADEAIRRSAKVPLNRPADPIQYDQGIDHILGSVPGRPSAGSEGGRGEGETLSGQQTSFKFEQPPRSLSEAADRQDEAAEQMADTLKAAAPGTYRRTLSKMTPPSGDMVFKDPNAVQNVTMRPETMARMDTRSGAIWNAEKAKEYDANSMVDDLRQRIAGTMLKLNDTQRRNVYAARELDRINGNTRADTGFQVVARNDGADFAHFSKPGQVVTLTPKETAAYHALSDMFDRSWKNVMEGAARKVGYAGAWDKDDMAANMQEMASAAQQATDKGGRDAAARALKIVGALDEQRRQGYHPLMRFGDYFAHVTPKTGTDPSSTGGFPKTLRFELAEKRLQDEVFGGQRVGNQAPPYAKEMLDRLKAQYPADKFNIEHGYLAKNPNMLDRVDIPAIEKLMTFMENDMLSSMRQEGRARGLSKEDAKAEAQRRYDDLYGATVDRLWEKAFKELESGYKKRSGTVPGYSDDWDRALGTYMHWTSRNVADQINRNAIDEAHTAMETDPRVNSGVKQYWRDWRDYQTRPSNVFNKGVNGMARWGFLTAMGMNPSSTAVVGTHGLFMAGPTLSVGVGMNKAAPAYSKAMAHALGAIKVDQTGLHIADASAAGRTPGEKALLKSLDAQGVLHSRAIEDMSALNEKQSDLWGNAKTQARKFMDMALSNVSVMDRANRIASALSAYRLGQDPATLAAMDKAWSGNQIWRDRRTTNGVTAENMARFMAPNMVGEYGPMNRAPIERNAATKMMMGMHGFVTRLLSKMWQLGTMGPQGQQALLWTLGAFWTMAGMNGIPFTQDAQNAADLVWKTATGKDPMLGYRIQAGLAEMFGKAGADMILHGPVSTLGGVDVASRLGLGDLISRNWPTAENTLGAYPSIILGRVKAAAQDIRLGRAPAAAAAEFLPAGPRNVVRAARESEEGIRSGSGRTEVPAQDLTAKDAIARAAGFTPEKAEHAYQRGDFAYRARRSGMGAPVNPIPQRKGGRAR